MDQVNESQEHSGESLLSPRPALASELSGRELDAAVAERVMSWERVELFNNDLNPAFFSNPGVEPMYKQSSKSVYLCRPGRLAIKEPVIARELVGALTIGGDQDLPRYSSDIAAAMQVVKKMRCEREFHEFNLRYMAVWMCSFKNVVTGATGGYTANHPAIPPAEVICCAALAAVENGSRHRDREAATATT